MTIVEVQTASDLYLNCADGFWESYRRRPGMPRRRALLNLFQAHPGAVLPVNNKWQATSADPDLAYLMKRGVLRQIREGGGRRHAMNKSSRKRQSYLVLVAPSTKEAACSG